MNHASNINSSYIFGTAGIGGTAMPIGGDQSPKVFLDSVLEAVRVGDMTKLEGCRSMFISIPENIYKCRDSGGNTIVHYAVLHKNVSVLQYVVDELGGDIDCLNLLGKSPLHEAVRINNAPCCQFLLDRGARDDIACHSLSTPFHTAAACGSVQCLDLLLQHAENPRARVNEPDKNKATAILKCAYDGELRVFEWLLRNGADVDVKDINERTPLLIAVMGGRGDIINLLLENGVNVRHTDIMGNSALHYCASRCFPEIADKLIECGADVTMVNNDRNNALHLAAQNAHPEDKAWHQLVMLLIRVGGDTLLHQENNCKKCPVEFLPRSFRYLFCVKEVLMQKENAEHQAMEKTQFALESVDIRSHEIEVKRAAQRAAERAIIDEEERMLKEQEDRARLEYESRSRIEEAIEAKRLEAEEIARVKREAQAKKSNKRK